MTLRRDTDQIQLLLDGKVAEFNELVAEGSADLESADLRLADLRSAALLRADLRNAYLRNADLRGVDLLHADLDGASLHGARVSGARFPRDLGADEILLSVQHGTRLRARREG